MTENEEGKEGREAETSRRRQKEVPTEAIVVGYAMSRLDDRYLAKRQLATWEQALREAGGAVACPTQTINQLRDEFDPVHPNPRRGWHKRAIRPSRQKVLDELIDLSDDGLMALVDGILTGDRDATQKAVSALAFVNNVARNVAERLLTGKRAEEYFLAHSEALVQVPMADVLDMRFAACGYDFGTRERAEVAIEVKGLKEQSGGILFTDREWIEARRRRADYLLVVVGNLAHTPTARVIADPVSQLEVHGICRSIVVAEWHSQVTV